MYLIPKFWINRVISQWLLSQLDYFSSYHSVSVFTLNFLHPIKQYVFIWIVYSKCIHFVKSLFLYSALHFIGGLVIFLHKPVSAHARKLLLCHGEEENVQQKQLPAEIVFDRQITATLRSTLLSSLKRSTQLPHVGLL